MIKIFVAVVAIVLVVWFLLACMTPKKEAPPTSPPASPCHVHVPAEDEEEDYIQTYKKERQLLIKKIRALSCLGYVEYIATHLNMEFAEKGYSWFYANYVSPADLHMYNPDNFPYPEDMEKMFEVEANAAARYPLIDNDELHHMPSAISSEREFFNRYPAPRSADFTDMDMLEDAWETANEELKEVLKNMMAQYKYDFMRFKGHSVEDVAEIEYIGYHGSFRNKENKLFQEDMPLDKIKELKKVAEDYYQNEQLWNYYPIAKNDIDHIMFYDRIKSTLQKVTKKSTKEEEKEERQRLRKELDDFIK